MPHYLAIAIVIVTLLHYVINSSIITKRGYVAFPFSGLMQVILFLLVDVTTGGPRIMWLLIAVNAVMTIMILITAYTYYFKSDNVMMFYHDCAATVQEWLSPVIVLTLGGLLFHVITGTAI